MQTDISTNQLRVTDIREFIIVKRGIDFKLHFVDIEPGFKVFSENDPVLFIKVNGNDADCKADQLGTSLVYVTGKIIGDSFPILKKLNISVVESIEPETTRITMSAGIPVFK